MTKFYKFCATSATLIVLASGNVVFAQSLTTTAVKATTVTPVTAVPPSTLVTTTTDLTQPFTPEAPPVATTETTQETATTGTTAAGTQPKDTSVSSSATQETTETQTLPEPILPVLDIGADGQSNTQEGLLTPTETDETCANSDAAKAAILPSVIGNQIKVALMTLLGAILGAILWVLGSTLIGSARGRGEILHIKTIERQDLENKRTDTLAQSKAALTDALDNVIKQTGAKSSVDHAQFEEYCRAAADLEIFGSDATLQAHHKLVSMLSQQKPPAPEEFHAAKSHLLESLQNDIMGEPPTPRS